MKRLNIILASIGLATTTAFAALPASTDPTLVSVPQLPGGFVLGGSAYWLQPSATDGDLNFVVINTGTTPSFFSQAREVEPGYDWGWGANIGYIFPNTGNDINLSYFQLDTSDSAGPVFTRSSSVTTITNRVFNASADFDLDQVDLTAGQYIDIGCRAILHPFAGARYAELERKLNIAIRRSTTGLFTLNSSTQAPFKSDLNGVGPLVGMDGSYYLGMGFGAVGHFDAAALVSSIKNNSSETVQAVIDGVPDSLQVFASRGSINRIVPVLDGKLGLDYTFTFNNAANSDLTLEAGYQVSEYFNAIDSVVDNNLMAVQVLSAKVVHTADFADQGPYASLTLHI